MTALSDANAAGQAALAKLAAAMNAAVAASNRAKQQQLLDAINTLTGKLNALNKTAIAADDARLGPLNTQLDQVTASATAAVTDLSEVDTVLNNLAAAAALIDGIAGIAAKV